VIQRQVDVVNRWVSSCCGFVVQQSCLQLVVQQIHNKSK